MNLNVLLPDLQQLKDLLGLIESSATILALVLGGLWGYWLFRIRRQRHPRADLAQTIAHYPLTTEKMLVSVVTTILNNGEVLLPIRDGEVRVQQILPLVNPQLRQIIQNNGDLAEIFPDALPLNERERWRREIAWPLLEVKRFHWEEKLMQIEPGEKIRIQCDFILDRSLELIRIYSLVSNSAYEVVELAQPKVQKWWKHWQKNRLIPIWDVATLYRTKQSVDLPLPTRFTRLWQKVNSASTKKEGDYEKNSASPFR